MEERHFYHKTRVINFVHKWFKDHRPVLDKTPYVDPRSKFSALKVNPARANSWYKAFCTIGDNICNPRVPFKDRIQGIVKRFNTYEFFTDGIIPSLKVIPQDFRKINLSKLLKGTTINNFREKGLPLPINKVSKIVGVFKGTLPFKKDRSIYFRDNYVRNVLVNELNVDFSMIQEKDVFPGSWPFSCHNMVQMCTLKNNCYSPSDLINGVFSRVGIDFKLPYIKYWNIKVINGIMTKPKAFPGLLTSKLFSSERKLTTGFMKTFCIDYYNFIIKRYRQVFDLSLITLGGREKRVSYKGTFSYLRTRIVLMYEDIPVLLGQSVAVPLTKAFQRLNEGYNFIGRSLEQRNYRNIEKELLINPETNIIFNADFSNHDAWVDEYQIVVSFGILRLCFPVQWKFMDKLFYYFMSSVIFKHVVIPGSQLVYRITKGIATGHPFTSLINTTVAYITVSTAIWKVASYEEIQNTRLFVAGDDIIGTIPLSILEKLSYEIHVRSGMVIDPITDHCGPLWSNDPLCQRSFLKKKFTILGIAWNDYELYDNLYTSYGGLKRTGHEINRIIDSLMNGPCDFRLNRIIMKIIIYHFNKPRYFGLSILDPPFLTKGLPDYKYSKNYISRSGKRIYTKEYRKFIVKYFNQRIRLAFRWFNMGQPFPALGYKDDSYWIDATKIHVPSDKYPFRYLLKHKVRKHFGVIWQDLK